MRFVGRPNNVLMKGAPGNYEQGKVYQMSFNNSLFKFWELMVEPPVLVAPKPKPSDDVYDEPVYIPEEALSMSGGDVQIPSDVNVDPNADATIEPYMNFNMSTGELSPHTYTASDEPDVAEKTRDELKAILDEAGVVYKKTSRTKTLQKLVDKFVSEE